MIRPYRADDQEELIRLFRLNTPKYFDRSEESDLLRYLRNFSDHYFVVVENGQIIGAGGYNYFEDQAMARISWDLVHPDFQGRGIGKELALFTINEIRRKLPVKLIKVRTSQLVYEFYEKLGFVLERIEKDFWAKGFDLYEMKMDIARPEILQTYPYHEGRETEKEKMLSGKPYVASDEELVSQRMYARERTFEYNSLPPSEKARKYKIITDLLGKTGQDFLIEPPFRCDYGNNIEIGENFYSHFNLTILDCARVCIGNDVLLGPNVSIFTASHPLHHDLRKEGLEHAGPVTIGRSVWIGGNVVINANVEIGDRSVIGSGSVVTRDIPEDVFAAGNPCRVIRHISEEDKQQYLRRR